MTYLYQEVYMSNASVLTAVVLASALAAPVLYAADDKDHAAHHVASDQSEGTPEDKAAGMKMEKMQEQMKKMHEQMQKIQATTDPQARQKLMQEHMQSMREGMKMMHGMGGGMMGGKKGAPMMEEGASDKGAGMDKDSMEGMHKDGMRMGMMMKKRHQMMEQRLDMMEKMMDQMLEHEAAEQQMERGR
jgi:protein CpxP